MDELIEWFDLCNSKDVVFCFSEIWIKPNSSLPNVPGFSMFLSPFHIRPANRSGSYLPGSCIFVLDSFQAEHFEICEFIEESSMFTVVLFCASTTELLLFQCIVYHLLVLKVLLLN